MAGADSSAHMLALASTGFTLGLVHVLAGPDHLSALAALAVGTSWKAFILGFRWGIGHSTGLVVVAIVFIMLKGDLDLRSLGRYCDGLVGIFMICLGCYGVLGALKVFREKKIKRDPDWGSSAGALVSTSPQSSSAIETEEQHGSGRHSAAYSKTELDDALNYGMTHMETGYLYGGTASHRGLPKTGDVVVKPFTSNDPAHSNQQQHHHHHHHHDATLLADICPHLPYIDMHDPVTQKVISFSIGLLHGVAGPGGILGVLPAVEMQNWRYSFVYLGAFIFSSTVSMGTFAALYGEATRRLGATAESVELALSVFSAAMSIIVGTTWLVLSLMGKLDVLFH